VKTNTKVIFVVQIVIILVAVALILWKTGVLERTGVLSWLGMNEDGAAEKVTEEETDTGEVGENADENGTTDGVTEQHVLKEWEKIVCGNEVVQPNYSRELDYCLQGAQVAFAADFAVTNDCLARKALEKYLGETGRNQKYQLIEVRYLGSWYNTEYRDINGDGEQERYWKGTFLNIEEGEGEVPVYVNQKGEKVLFESCE